ncbi:MAG: hypothetical protein ACLFSZ_10855, partial [Puniceicoccaceae bacterium]
MALPMPEEAPVTRADFPARGPEDKFIGDFVFHCLDSVGRRQPEAGKQPGLCSGEQTPTRQGSFNIGKSILHLTAEKNVVIDKKHVL